MGRHRRQGFLAVSVLTLSAGATVALAQACGNASSGSGFGDGADTGLPSADYDADPFKDGSQGDGGLDPDAACTGTLVEPKRAPLDIVFSIDQSHSMADEIDRTQANINTFADIIRTSGLDYRVIMLGAPGTDRCSVFADAGCEDVPNVRDSGITADLPYGICVPYPLGMGVSGGCGDKPPNFFHLDHFPYGIQSNNAMNLITGMYPLSYRWAGTKANQPSDGGWQKWARLAAFKYLIVVSDDDETVPTAPSTPAEEDFSSCKAGMDVADCWEYRLFNARESAGGPLLFGPDGMWGTPENRKYSYNAIVGVPFYNGGSHLPDGGGGCMSLPDASIVNDAVNNGDMHQKLAKKTGGIVESICKEDWSPILSKLASSVVARLGCEYAVTPPTGMQVLDPDRVLVRYTPPGGTPTNLGRVSDASKCAQYSDHFYYDDNTTPTKVRLCPQACTTIGAASAGKMDVMLGCIAPPPK